MLLRIILDVVGPIMLLIGVGALLRAKFKLDVGTLSKLNIYFAVPAFIFHTVATSALPFMDMGGIVAITVLQVATLGVLIFGIGRLLRIDHKTLSAIALAVMFYNSGNYGLPLAELAYPDQTTRDGGAVQAFVVMAQNFLIFTVGLGIAASSHSRFAWSVLWRVAKLPMIPALLLGLLAKWWIGTGHALPVIIAKPAAYVAAALVPIALVTLGAQLASSPRWPRWKPVGAVLVLRLVFGPIQMAGLLYGLHLIGWPPLDLWGSATASNWGWPAELLILTAAVPTAVNTLLLTLELDGDANLAADCVFWTTLASCFTIPLWLWVIWSVSAA